MDKNIDVLALHLAGGRLSGEKSYALEQSKYGDPANHVKYEREKAESSMGTKEIEGILRHDIDNWMRWALQGNWRPASFTIPLGRLYKSTDVHEPSYRPAKIDEIGAGGLEKIIVRLPERHRTAFVAHHLEKGIINGRVVRLGDRHDGARLLKVQVCMYHRIVNQAHLMVLRECRRQGKYISQEKV
jgi:hypothetical protein